MNFKKPLKSASFGMAVAIIAVLSMIPVGSYAVQLQNQSIFTWTENKGDGTGAILVTPAITNATSAPTAIDNVTSYVSDFTFDSSPKTLSINRQNIIPLGPGAATAYMVGPISLEAIGSTIEFSAWLNPSAQEGSSETIEDIEVNGMSLPETVTADWTHPSEELQYVSSTPILSVEFDYVIDAVAGSSETGIGVSMPSEVPEPGTLSLIGMGAALVAIYRKRRF